MSGLSNHFDTMISIQTIINQLSLSGIQSATIQEVATNLNGQIPTPFVSISPYGPERLEDELNSFDGVYYGTLVAIIAKPDVTSLETRLSWRQSLRRNLNNHAINGLTQNYNLKVEPGNVIEPRAWFDQNVFVSGFVVRAYFQEPRS